MTNSTSSSSSPSTLGPMRRSVDRMSESKEREKERKGVEVVGGT